MGLLVEDTDSCQSRAHVSVEILASAVWCGGRARPPAVCAQTLQGCRQVRHLRTYASKVKKDTQKLLSFAREVGLLNGRLLCYIACPTCRLFCS